MVDLFKNMEFAAPLAQAIVDTVREPVLVLGPDLRVIAGSRSFFLNFGTDSKDILGQKLFDICQGQFDIPILYPLLKKIAPDHAILEGFEVSVSLPAIGKRTFILNARKVFYPEDDNLTLLIAFEDVTERRARDNERADLLRRTEELLQQKEMLLKEIQHRVANSLQIIAGILMMKARSVTSEETREHLRDAQLRVISVATVQQNLESAGKDDVIAVGPYLTKLCKSLASSMVSDDRAVSLEVIADDGRAGSAQAVSLGLIVMELVINALKHAFPDGHPNARVIVRYEASGSNWRLVVSDNGVGKTVEPTGAVKTKGGLGTSLVKALAQQLEAHVETVGSETGVSISITRGAFNSRTTQQHCDHSTLQVS
jgi:chemotaxis protein methyltransferase CheR